MKSLEDSAPRIRPVKNQVFIVFGFQGWKPLTEEEWDGLGYPLNWLEYLQNARKALGLIPGSATF